jgi:hypothetical protein
LVPVQTPAMELETTPSRPDGASFVRRLTEGDFEAVWRAEQAIWPDGLKATEPQLRERFALFPEGCWGAFEGDRLVGFATSIRIAFTPGEGVGPLLRFLPRRGDCNIPHNPTGNCVHFLSGGVIPSHRRRGHWGRLIDARLGVARRLRLDHAVIDSRMPWYCEHARSHPGCTPDEYAMTRRDGRSLDPVVAKLEAHGFRYYGLCDSSYPDCESGERWVYLHADLRQRGPAPTKARGT